MGKLQELLFVCVHLCIIFEFVRKSAINMNVTAFNFYSLTKKVVSH